MHRHLPSHASAVEAEALPCAGFSCPDGARYYDLIRLLARRRLSFRLPAYAQPYAYRHLSTSRDLPCCVTVFRDIPPPIRRRFLRGCASSGFSPSMAFAFIVQARLPLHEFHDAAGFTSCYGLSLRPFPRFSIPARAETLEAAYMADWPLPWQNLHLRDNDSFQGTYDASSASHTWSTAASCRGSRKARTGTRWGLGSRRSPVLPCATRRSGRWGRRRRSQEAAGMWLARRAVRLPVALRVKV